MQPASDSGRQQLDEQLNNFVEACSIVNSSLDETKLLYSIVDVAVMLTASRHGRVFMRDSTEPKRLVMRAAKGRRREGTLHESLPPGQGAAWVVLDGGEAIMSNDAEMDPRFQWQPDERDPAIRKILCVPMLSPDHRVIGVIELHNKRGASYSAEDRYFMELIAQQAGACLTSSNLFAQMREERHWISSIVDSMSDGLIVTDPHGEIVLANETARTLFNLDEESHPPPDDLNLKLMLREVALMDDREVFDFVMLKPQAEILSVRTTVLSDSTGATKSVILGMRNVRELKEIERKNREFLSLVSHELESHYTRMAPGLPTELGAQSTEVADLISNLVFYSEIEAGPMRLERRVCDLRELLIESCNEFTGEIQARGIGFEIEADKVPPILLDPERISVLIKGILRYIVGQVSSGGNIQGRVELDTQAPLAVIVFAIEGLELSVKEIGDLFDKTYQVENFISILGRQTAGLRLIFLKHIAEAHGGDFWVVPTGPQAVSFCVSLRR